MKLSCKRTTYDIVMITSPQQRNVTRAQMAIGFMYIAVKIAWLCRFETINRRHADRSEGSVAACPGSKESPLLPRLLVYRAFRSRLSNLVFSKFTPVHSPIDSHKIFKLKHYTGASPDWVVHYIGGRQARKCYQTTNYALNSTRIKQHISLQSISRPQ